MTLTTDQREALRQKVMAEMSRRMPIISKRFNEWRDWPGTWAFADVAVAALQDELARVNALLERAEKAEKALAETDWAAAVDNAAGGVKELPAFHPCSFCKTEGACRDRGCADAAIGREIAARGELGGPVPLPRSVGGTGCAAADFARDAGKMTAAGVGGPLKGQQ